MTTIARNRMTYPTAAEIAAHLGTRNWVVARKTPRIITNYGPDVICLSPQKFKTLQNHILASRRTTT